MTAKKRGRGRPPFKPTKAQREHVKTCKATGMTNDELALGLGIDRNTLEKHFAFELGQGAANRRHEAINRLWELGKKGNVSALKAYIAKMEEDPHAFPPLPEQPRMTDQQAAGKTVEQTEQTGAPAAEPAEKAPKPGKKEIAQEQAFTAHQDTGWADILPTHTRPQ